MLYNFSITKHIQNNEYFITVNTFYTMTNSFPTLSMITSSSYRTMACTLKGVALLALSLYLKINCFGSLVTLSV